MIILNIFHLFNGLYKLIGLKNQYYPQYNNSIFFWVGLVSFVLPIIISYLYYCVANGFDTFDALRKTRHWWMFLSLNNTIIILFTLFVSRSITQLGAFDGYMVLLSVANVVLSSIIFFLFSLWFKRYSKQAKRRPIEYIPFYKN